MSETAESGDILMILYHPHGEIETTLQEWMVQGPGERDLLKPVAVRNRVTGESVSIKTIPLAYRNNNLSRILMKLGILSNPWE